MQQCALYYKHYKVIIAFEENNHEHKFQRLYYAYTIL